MRFFFLLLFFTFQMFSQQKYSYGEITSNIPVKNSNKETFDLYLPKNYNPNKKNAIIFIFDPSGFGKNGLKPFISSSEKFNYILVCSNNTKNGPYQENFNITNRLFAHIFSTFNIDDKQIYTAGFSGGSRLASSIAVLTNSIQGVIGCGAGFANEANIVPTFNNNFSYVGLVGDEDMNYHEMLDLKIWLNKININNELFTYEDGHRWPKSNQIMRALGWLELQAYKKKLRSTNDSIIKILFKKDYLIAKRLEKKQPYNSIVEYYRIKKNYSKYYNLDSISNKIPAIKLRKDYKKELKDRKTIKLRENKIFSLLLGKFKEETKSSNPLINSKWWEKEMKKLDKISAKSKTIFTTKMIKRIRYRIMATAIESSNAFLWNKKIRKAFYCDSLLTIIRPNMPRAYFRLAQSYARINKYPEVIRNLKKAIELGFNSKRILFGVKEFKSYHEKKEFNELLNLVNN